MKNALSLLVLIFAGFLMPGPAAAEGPAPVPTDIDRVREGTVAPDFSLLSQTGDRVKLSDYRKSKNVILLFYRGYW